MIKAVRGTRDLLPPETALWNFVEAAVRDVFRAYNFHEIRTPIFESTELFARGVGEETDVVTKEMYVNPPKEALEATLRKAWLRQHGGRYNLLSWAPNETYVIARSSDPSPFLIEFSYKPTALALIDVQSAAINQPDGVKHRAVIAVPEWEVSTVERLSRGIEIHAVKVPDWLEPRNSYTLRPENTAGVVRAYIEHDLEKRGLNKLYYIGPQFRRERPQKGRYRQFYQIGAEVIGPKSSGSDKPLRDAEVLEMLATLLSRLGIQDWKLKINSVGSSSERQIFNEVLRKALEPVASQMCSDCQRRAMTNPLRVLDCKVPADQPIIEKLPRISDYLDTESKEHFMNVRALLNSAGVPFEIDHRLVRGLDYYTRTAFEFTHGALGAQNAILGGGRYDGLSEALGGPSAPGIGFAIGEDRLVLALQELMPTISRPPDVYIAPVGEGMNRAALRLAADLRRHDLVVEMGDRSFRLKKLLETASKLGSRYAIIVGENEIKSDVFALKNLETGEQVSVPRAELVSKIQTR
jgi:histidyl-tRNA synthetase